MQFQEGDKELFQNLADSELGNRLVDYLRRFQADFCDVRKMTDGENSTSIKRAADAIQSDIIDKIQLQTRSKDVSTNDFE